MKRERSSLGTAVIDQARVRRDRPDSAKTSEGGTAQAGWSRGEFAPVSRNEQEVVVRLDAESGLAHIASAWPARSRRLARLYGPPQRVARTREGTITTCCWAVPLTLVSFRRPRKPGSGNPAGLARLRVLGKAGP